MKQIGPHSTTDVAAAAIGGTGPRGRRLLAWWRPVCLGGLFLLLSAFVVLGPRLSAKYHAWRVANAAREQDGILVETVRSPFQAGQTEIKVLLPDVLEKGKRYRAVYVLPVEAGTESRYGVGLVEVKRLNLHNRFATIFITPTFSQVPWYADHPTDSRIQQETYLLREILPRVEKQYPVRVDRGGRYLLGFSKSGWGAFSLLLRHPDLFSRAAAWDAALSLERPDRYDMREIFGNQENFEKYCVSTLLARQAAELGDCRLILMGYGLFRGDLAQTHERMTTLGIPHVYRDGPERPHDWHSGWLEEAVELLLAP
jgi:hypothetical protein